MAQYVQKYPEIIFRDLKHSIIKLEEWHISTLSVSASNRNIGSLLTQQITIPFVIQCSKLSFIANDYYPIFGGPDGPIDINEDKNIWKLLEKLDFHKLSNYLSINQFPCQTRLPDSEGKFLIFPIDNIAPVNLKDIIISNNQQQILMNETQKSQDARQLAQDKRQQIQDDCQLIQDHHHETRDNYHIIQDKRQILQDNRQKMLDNHQQVQDEYQVEQDRRQKEQDRRQKEQDRRQKEQDV